jgi:hypothetical protein
VDFGKTVVTNEKYKELVNICFCWGFWKSYWHLLLRIHTEMSCIWLGMHLGKEKAFLVSQGLMQSDVYENDKLFVCVFQLQGTASQLRIRPHKWVPLYALLCTCVCGFFCTFARWGKQRQPMYVQKLALISLVARRHWDEGFTDPDDHPYQYLYTVYILVHVLSYIRLHFPVWELIYALCL